MPHRPPVRRALDGTPWFVACALLLAGCSAPVAPPAVGSSPTAAPGTAPDGPAAYVPGGTAEQNRAYFDAVSGALFAATPDAGSAAVLDALTEAGFTRDDLEVTDDSTPLGNPVDSLQFAVRIGDSCLIGERAAGAYSSGLAPALGTGRCLVGATLPVD